MQPRGDHRANYSFALYPKKKKKKRASMFFNTGSGLSKSSKEEKKSVHNFANASDFTL